MIDNFENIEPNSDSLIFYNSISNAQDRKEADLLNGEDSLLIHSKFNISDKKRLMSELMSLYGKNNCTITNKKNVIGTPILQASLNISFGNIYEIPCSPQTTVQLIGRDDRYGNYPATPTFNMCKTRNIGEISAINTVYDIDLTKSWIKFCLLYTSPSPRD